MMVVEGEINNFIMVWTVATATVCYCHAIGNWVPKGRARLIALFPAIALLFILPMRLTSVHLAGLSCFFLGWLSTFKLILFAFHKGPLSSNPPLPLSHFIPLAFFPIKFLNYQTTTDKKIAAITNNDKTLRLRRQGTFMAILLASFLPLYEFKESLHPAFVLFLYGLHMYTGMEIVFTLVLAATRRVLGVQLERQLIEPYKSTSLQDFWGRRWNLSVSRVLHPLVYDPVMKASSRVVGRKWAPVPGIVATFAVSGLMHEMVFYCVKREKATWEKWEPCWDSMSFFLLHGVCLAIEVAIKKKLARKWQLPKAVSLPLTAAFVVSTALWLFVPALVRARVFDKAKAESLAFAHFFSQLIIHFKLNYI